MARASRTRLSQAAIAAISLMLGSGSVWAAPHSILLLKPPSAVRSFLYTVQSRCSESAVTTTPCYGCRLGNSEVGRGSGLLRPVICPVAVRSAETTP
jgi:hypothetical protein